MSTIKVTTIQNLAGVEVYTAKAWVNFNGTGTVAIRASGNVSSITDNGTGDYTVNFTVAMVDANYAITIGARNEGTNVNTATNINQGAAPTTTACRIQHIENNVVADLVFLCVAIHR
jgi:hypothetical protein